MSLLKLDLLYAFAIFLIAIFASEAKAFSCVAPQSAAANATIQMKVLNSATPCAAGQFAILAPAEMTSLTTAVADIAALKTSVTSLQTTATALQNTTTTQSTSITGLQNITASQTSTITTLQNSVSSQAASITALQSAVVAMQGALGVAQPPFDMTLAAAYWSFAMTFVVGAWLISKKAGMILSAIKRL